MEAGSDPAKQVKRKADDGHPDPIAHADAKRQRVGESLFVSGDTPPPLAKTRTDVFEKLTDWTVVKKIVRMTEHDDKPSPSGFTVRPLGYMPSIMRASPHVRRICARSYFECTIFKTSFDMSGGFAEMIDLEFTSELEQVLLPKENATVKHSGVLSKVHRPMVRGLMIKFTGLDAPRLQSFAHLRKVLTHYDDFLPEMRLHTRHSVPAPASQLGIFPKPYNTLDRRDYYPFVRVIKPSQSDLKMFTTQRLGHVDEEEMLRFLQRLMQTILCRRVPSSTDVMVHALMDVLVRVPRLGPNKYSEWIMHRWAMDRARGVEFKEILRRLQIVHDRGGLLFE